MTTYEKSDGTWSNECLSSANISVESNGTVVSHDGMTYNPYTTNPCHEIPTVEFNQPTYFDWNKETYSGLDFFIDNTIRYVLKNNTKFLNKNKKLLLL